MFFNLTWRNAKRSRSENLIYFLTMITAVAMFYIVLSLGQQDVIRFLSEIESDAVERLLTNLLPTVYLCALLFVFFLVVFANKYQLECRSRELGLYLMFGMTKNQVISDKKGLMFILGQIISNSVKYVGNNLAPRLIFSIADSMNSEQISLSIKDNGTSIPLSDLPFVFDKGFTGDTGSYLSRSTGMGLYLVQKMATDLFITVELKNNSYGGTTVTLTFPKV